MDATYVVHKSGCRLLSVNKILQFEWISIRRSPCKDIHYCHYFNIREARQCHYTVCSLLCATACCIYACTMVMMWMLKRKRVAKSRKVIRRAEQGWAAAVAAAATEGGGDKQTCCRKTRALEDQTPASVASVYTRSTRHNGQTALMSVADLYEPRQEQATCRAA